MATYTKQAQVPATRAARLSACATANATYAKQARSAARTARKQAVQATKQQAYMLAVQQLAAQYGVPVPTTLSVRAQGINRAQVHAPSTIQGACGVVRAWVAANPLATRAMCLQHFNGTINPATVSTQYAIARKQISN